MDSLMWKRFGNGPDGPASSTLSSTMTHATPTSTALTGSPTHTSITGTGGGSSGGKPLLFFVALGFGVVFTNLWIIVGVKYCFRYNSRHRGAQIDQETGEPIDLTHMQRPRRRREKKLMSMDEVNERFPLIKYKLWRATREQEGLPAAGGVTAPPSRAASIREASKKSMMMERGSTEVDSTADAAAETSLSPESDVPHLEPSTETQDFAARHICTTEKQATSTVTAKDATITTLESSPTSSQPETSTPLADEEDDDPIRTALPATLADASPGDACAICIDNLDDEDEVRGLTCGHAFHAGCLDPWLTSRRACCPLCKADYYVPKPRTALEASEAGTGRRRRTGVGHGQGDGTDADTVDSVDQPPNVWIGGRGIPFRSRVVFAGQRYNVEPTDRFGVPVFRMDRAVQRSERRRREQTRIAQMLAENAGEDPPAAATPSQTFGGRARETIGRIPNRFRRAPRTPPAAEESTTREAAEETDATSDGVGANGVAEEAAEVTPGMLEAGQRSVT